MKASPITPIVIRRSDYLPLLYVTWGESVMAYANLRIATNVRVPDRKIEITGRVVANLLFSVLPWETRRAIVSKMDRLEVGDVGF